MNPPSQPTNNEPKENNMITQDDRTPEQKTTHRWGIVARDNFMSGWGEAQGGTSRCAWACDPKVNLDRVLDWVKRRGEMRFVNVVDLSTYRPPKGTTHYHIYVCNPGHPATQ